MSTQSSGAPPPKAEWPFFFYSNLFLVCGVGTTTCCTCPQLAVGRLNVCAAVGTFGTAPLHRFELLVRFVDRYFQKLGGERAGAASSET